MIIQTIIKRTSGNTGTAHGDRFLWALQQPVDSDGKVGSTKPTATLQVLPFASCGNSLSLFPIYYVERYIPAKEAEYNEADDILWGAGSASESLRANILCILLMQPWSRMLAWL